MILPAVALLGAGHAMACLCVQQPAVEKIVAQHTLIFVGRVVTGRFLGDDLSSGETYGRQFTFLVSDTLKGTVRHHRATIVTGVGGGDCGMDLVIGRQYLVYSRQRQDGQFVTGLCDYTKDYLPYGQKEAEEVRRWVTKVDHPGSSQ